MLISCFVIINYDSALKRYRNDIQKKNPYRCIENQIGIKRYQKTSKEPMTSADSVIARSTVKKSKLKGGSMQEDDSKEVECFDEILHNNNL